MGIQKFATGFEDCTVGATTFTSGFPYFHYFHLTGGATVRIETALAHSGTKCFALKTPGATSSMSQFNIYPKQTDATFPTPLIETNEYYVATSLYFPSDWQIKQSATGFNWCPLATLIGSATLDVIIEITQDGYTANPADQIFNIGVISDTTVLNRINNFPLPRGRWFKLIYYVRTHATDGQIQVWIDDRENGGSITEICNATGLALLPTTNDWWTGIRTQATNVEPDPHEIFIDDLDIWDGLPSAPSPPSADFAYLPLSPTVGQTIQFTDMSTDPDNDITSWSWDFGDGIGVSIERDPTYAYNASGTYTVTLTVTDSNGLFDSIQKQIYVETPPQGSGRIEVHASLDSIEIVTAAEVVGDGSGNTPFLSPLLTVPVGGSDTFTVNCTYESQILTKTVVVNDGEVTVVTFQFALPPAPQIPAWLIALPIIGAVLYFLWKQ